LRNREIPSAPLRLKRDAPGTRRVRSNRVATYGSPTSSRSSSRTTAATHTSSSPRFAQCQSWAEPDIAQTTSSWLRHWIWC